MFKQVRTSNATVLEILDVTNLSGSSTMSRDTIIFSRHDTFYPYGQKWSTHTDV